jgi:hypothetical protein
MQNKSNSIANKISAKLTNNYGYSFDPLTLIMIAGLILNVVRLIYECKNSSEERVATLQKPNLLEKIILRRHVGKACLGTDIKPSDLYRELVRWNVSSDEANKLFKEVKTND